jgi:hypothetical protein
LFERNLGEGKRAFMFIAGHGHEWPPICGNLQINFNSAAGCREWAKN